MKDVGHFPLAGCVSLLSRVSNICFVAARHVSLPGLSDDKRMSPGRVQRQGCYDEIHFEAPLVKSSTQLTS